MWEYTSFCDVISHHGVEGQQWGVRNGPPYPLDQSKALKRSKDKKELASRARGMSTQELQDALNRLNLEKRYISELYVPGAKDYISAKLRKYGDQTLDTLAKEATKGFAKSIFDKNDKNNNDKKTKDDDD